MSTLPFSTGDINTRINIQPDPKKIARKRFLVFLISLSPGEVHVKIFPKFDHGKGSIL